MTRLGIRCFCGGPFAGRKMIECDECTVWVHLTCAKIKKNKVPDKYVCLKELWSAIQNLTYYRRNDSKLVSSFSSENRESLLVRVIFMTHFEIQSTNRFSYDSNQLLALSAFFLSLKKNNKKI